MKRTRGLWVSVIVIGLLVVASVGGFVSRTLKPTLGLDLQGGVAVILSAPAGTPADVMQQALENIRRRVDAFGVGEPEIFVSGTTIEVQIPGTANSTVRSRVADLYCLQKADGTNYGCASTQADAQAALDGLETTSQATEVCLFAKDGTKVTCAPTKAEADAAKAGYSIAPKASPTPTPSGSISASPSASASASSSPSPSAAPSVGPVPPAASYCLTDPSGTQPVCAATQAAAQQILNGLTTTVTKHTFCITPSLPKPSPTPTPTPSSSAGPSASASASASASPSSSPSPSGIEAFVKLDRSGADQLPCAFDTKQAAQDALSAVSVGHVTTQYCVVGADGKNLGCYDTSSGAAQRQRETGQQRLLDVIGTTARLEERRTIQIIPSGDPSYATIPVTCGTAAEQATAACKGDAQDGNEVFYLDDASPPNKVRLGPVVITGGNIKKAGALLDQNQQWKVTFKLDGPGAKAFGEATTIALVAPPPQNQIAIAVDRTIVSNPRVEGAITGGTGEITGNFSQTEAKDLATLLNAGSLPVELTRQSVRTVSPTLGTASLKQGIVAGVAGLVLLFLYLLFYYRLLGIVAWFGMSIWAIFAIAIVSWAGREFGYALTLAGVAGLVISLGVTADSYIVFFERLKDELRSGRSPRTVVQPAFRRAFRTIVAADTVTGLAAAVLYMTAVSSVRGFALTLGVATGLDLFVVYFFKRPTVFLLARSKRLVEMRGFGLTAAAAHDHTAADEGGAG